MDCFTCTSEAINVCKRCARPYCDDHGNATYCSDCLQPASAMPSFNLYRGALLTMLVGTAVAVFFIIRPPTESGGASEVVVADIAATATPSSGGATRTVASGASTPVASDETPPAGETPAATETGATATPGAAPTEAPWIEYIVEEGDTLFDIATEFAPAEDNVADYAAAIANFNGLDPENPVLVPGDLILLPRPVP